MKLHRNKQSSRTGISKAIPILILILLISGVISIGVLWSTDHHTDGVYPDSYYVVPWMDPPNFDGIISSDWASALRIDVNFVIPMRDNPDGRQNISATFYLGHNRDYLFVASLINSPGLNPYTNETMTVPDRVRLFFDVDNDSALTQPEDGKEWFFFMKIIQGNWTLIDGFNGDLYWGTEINPWFHQGWTPETQWNWDDSNPDGSVFEPYPGWFWGESNEEGDEIVEVSIPLRSTDLYDGLNLENGKQHVLGLCMEFDRQQVYYENDLYDDWPGEGFTPSVCDNPGQYAKIVIDLR